MTSEDMNIPLELPCGHELNISGINNLVEKTKRFEQWPCPNCSRIFSLSAFPSEYVRENFRNKIPEYQCVDAIRSEYYVRENFRNKIPEYQCVDAIRSEGKIMGMTVIGDELFIVRKSPPNVIFKYDISARAPGPPVELCISMMKWPRGIAASETSSCLYITDWHKMFGGRLWRYKYQTGRETEQEEPVATLNAEPFGVSVSQKTDHVFVTCANPINILVNKGWIYIYKPNGSDFQKIRTIELPGLEFPRHSIVTQSSELIVCHGWHRGSHGVTSYSLNVISGPIKKQFFYGKCAGGGSDERDMNRPLSMSQYKEGLILVVDYYNHRIQLLTEDLRLVRHFITEGITYPRHICQHSNSARIYVGQEDGNVQIFDVQE